MSPSTILFLLAMCSLSSFSCQAASADITLQLKYSPWGVIDADEDARNSFWARPYEPNQLEFERSLGVRAMYEPVYVALHRYTNNPKLETGIDVDTYSVGLGGINDHTFAHNSNIYLLGAVGAGRGDFVFRNDENNDWEAFIEANAEIGIRIKQHLLVGVGFDWQLFGEPGDTKAHYRNLYFSTGLTF